MEWLTKLIEKHTKDGVVNQEELIKEVNTDFPKHAVPKEKYNTLADNKKKLEEDIQTRDTQLEELKKVDAEGLKNQIEALQEENKTNKETYDNELKDLQLTNAIKLSLSGKVHDESIVSGLVDKTKLLVSDDGSVVGLDDQLTTLKESKAFLFKEEDTKNNDNQQQSGFQKIGNDGSSGNQGQLDSAVAAAFGNTEAK